jgi:hypothetical protein
MTRDEAKSFLEENQVKPVLVSLSTFMVWLKPSQCQSAI